MCTSDPSRSDQLTSIMNCVTFPVFWFVNVRNDNKLREDRGKFWDFTRIFFLVGCAIRYYALPFQFEIFLVMICIIMKVTRGFYKPMTNTEIDDSEIGTGDDRGHIQFFPLSELYNGVIGRSELNIKHIIMITSYLIASIFVTFIAPLQGVIMIIYFGFTTK